MLKGGSVRLEARINQGREEEEEGEGEVNILYSTRNK